MHKQKTAEQERRSMRLLATSDFEAAQQQKLAVIQRAEGKAEAIRLVNEAAEKYFVCNAQALQQIEMIENSLRENSKIVITEHGIRPTLLLGRLPVSLTNEEKGTDYSYCVSRFQVTLKGKKMGNQIACPNCKKTIANHSIIEQAANGEGSDTQSIICDCGERITYWQITAQLRDQKKMGWRFQKWVQNLSIRRG